MIKVNTIICGAMPEATKVIPDGSINCSISSPPYWALRDYGVDGQLGLEPTFEEYIDKLCTIYDEVKRVLRKDGTCWVNLGDTYGGHNGVLSSGGRAGFAKDEDKGMYLDRGLAKSLCLIPQRFAIEMVNRGWILRNVIIWHKPNPMPSSAKDRFTVDFEYVYFFVKSKKYWFEPQYEPVQDCTIKRDNYGHSGGGPYAMGRPREPGEFMTPLGRNKRTVWTIPTQPFPEAHFATFPEKLVEPMIKAGCPEFVCTKCGKGREKIYDVEKTQTRPDLSSKYGQPENDVRGGSESLRKREISNHYFKGYTDCGCNADWRPGIVCDIFAGSGTTLQVAARLRRDWIGIELKPEYIEMAEKRARQGETGLSVKEQNKGQQPLFPSKTINNS
jgi:DNA modification methylase